MTFRRFDTPGPVTVKVNCKAGSVRLETHDEPTTEVEVSALDSTAEDLVSQVRIADERSGDRHRVVVDVPSNGSTGEGGFLRRVINLTTDGPGVKVVVRCPAGSDLDVTTASASIDAVGRFGAVATKSASGDTEVDQVTGELAVHAASGDVSVGAAGAAARIESASGDVRCGTLGGVSTISTASGDVIIKSAAARLTVHSASGDVEAYDVLAGCEIQTASGDLRIERAVAGDTRLESVSGDLRIGIAKGTAVRVDAQSITGDLVSEIDLDIDPIEDQTDPGGPTLDLRARTVSGDIRIERAPAFS
jgi:hypothetical protein